MLNAISHLLHIPSDVKIQVLTPSLSFTSSLESEDYLWFFPQVRSSPGRNCLRIRDTSKLQQFFIYRGSNVVGWFHVNHWQVPVVLVVVPSTDLDKPQSSSHFLLLFKIKQTCLLRTTPGSQCNIYCSSAQWIVQISVTLFPSLNHLWWKDSKYTMCLQYKPKKHLNIKY